MPGHDRENREGPWRNPETPFVIQAALSGFDCLRESRRRADRSLRQVGELDCIKAFSETDFTTDLKQFDVPTLFLHGDDDQIVPIGDSAMIASKLVKGATLKVYPGSSHGMCTVDKDKVNADLLEFIRA